MGYTGKLKKSALYIGTEEDNSQLLPGVNNQFLSIEDGNLKWSPMPASAPSMILVKSFKNISQREIFFDDIGSFNNYLLIINGLDILDSNTGTYSSALALKVSNDNGLTYINSSGAYKSCLIYGISSAAIFGTVNSQFLSTIQSRLSPIRSVGENYIIQNYNSIFNLINLNTLKNVRISGDFDHNVFDDTKRFSGNVTSNGPNSINAFKLYADWPTGSLVLNGESSIDLYGIPSS